MNDTDQTDFIVTIRAAGERTEELCHKIVQEQAVGAKTLLIQKEPFKLALEECFKVAIHSQLKWLITVDADMLLLPGSIKLLLKQAEKMPDN